MNIKIERMTQEDIPSVLEIEKSQNVHILSENVLNNDVSKYDLYYYIVAKTEDNKIIGYAGISFVLDSADLLSIVVDSNYSRLGIATKLLENIYTFCIEKQITSIILEVRHSNEKAKALYLKHGFEQISIRKNYYDNIEDALILKKELL